MILKLSWRNLWRNTRRSLITICSIGIGLACTLFLTALGDGVYGDLVDGAVRIHAGHVTVTHPLYADAPRTDRRIPSVEAVRKAAASISEEIELIKPLILGQGTVSTGKGSESVAIIAVDPDTERVTSPMARNMVAGRYLEKRDERGAVLGKSLADRLKLKPGKKLVVTTSDVHGELVTELLRVTGVFELGMEDTDGFLIQVPLQAGRRIFGLGDDEATMVGLVLSHHEQKQKVLRHLAEALETEPVVVLPWEEVLYDLASYMFMERAVTYVLEGILFFVVMFTILNTILMSVVERGKEFSVVLALGTTPRLLAFQILVEATMLAFLGCILGLMVGGGYSYYVELHGLDLSGIFHEGAAIAGFAIDPLLKADLTVGVMAKLSVLVFVFTVLISVYPAIRSGRVKMADALRVQ